MHNLLLKVRINFFNTWRNVYHVFVSFWLLLLVDYCVTLPAEPTMHKTPEELRF
jgi:hypothetical protein